MIFLTKKNPKVKLLRIFLENFKQQIFFMIIFVTRIEFVIFFYF